MEASAAVECDGYKKLMAAVEKDEAGDERLDYYKRTGRYSHDYRAKLAWVLERAAHYAEKTGMPVAELLDAWERDRSYWYMNYYQDAQQPEIKDDSVRVFDTPEDFKASVGKTGFRCPNCKGVSRDPQTCNSGDEMDAGKVCDWKAYGLFRTLGEGITIFVKADVRMVHIFMPVAWEKSADSGKDGE